MCNLGKYFTALDGCSKHYKVLPQNYDANSRSAEVQCCSLDGQFCYRKNPDSGKCWSGNNDALKVTWCEAYEMCTSAGYRLCKNQEEMDRCCGSGCFYDYTLVWTSIEPGTQLQAIH